MSYASSNEGEVSHLPRVAYLGEYGEHLSHGDDGVHVPSHVCLLSLCALCDDHDIQHGTVRQTKNLCKHHDLEFEFEYPPSPKEGPQVWTRNEVGFASCWIYIYLEEMDEDYLKE